MGTRVTRGAVLTCQRGLSLACSRGRGGCRRYRGGRRGFQIREDTAGSLVLRVVFVLGLLGGDSGGGPGFLGVVEPLVPAFFGPVVLEVVVPSPLRLPTVSGQLSLDKAKIFVVVDGAEEGALDAGRLRNRRAGTGAAILRRRRGGRGGPVPQEVQLVQHVHFQSRPLTQKQIRIN